MTEAMPFLQKYDITFLRPPTILPGLFFCAFLGNKGAERTLGGRHLTIEDRRELEKYYLDRISVESIAETLRVHRSTIYNELRRGDTGRVDKNGNCEYSAELAQKRICDARRSIHHKKQEDTANADV